MCLRVFKWLLQENVLLAPISILGTPSLPILTIHNDDCTIIMLDHVQYTCTQYDTLNHKNVNIYQMLNNLSINLWSQWGFLCYISYSLLSVYSWTSRWHKYWLFFVNMLPTMHSKFLWCIYFNKRIDKAYKTLIIMFV